MSLTVTSVSCEKATRCLPSKNGNNGKSKKIWLWIDDVN